MELLGPQPVSGKKARPRDAEWAYDLIIL